MTRNAHMETLVWIYEARNIGKLQMAALLDREAEISPGASLSARRIPFYVSAPVPLNATNALVIAQRQI